MAHGSDRDTFLYTIGGYMDFQSIVNSTYYLLKFVWQLSVNCFLILLALFLWFMVFGGLYCLFTERKMFYKPKKKK